MRFVNNFWMGVGVGVVVAAICPRSSLAQDLSRSLVVAHSSIISERGASLTFELANGDEVKVSLVGGEIRLNDDEIGEYTRGGDLEVAWQTLVSEAGRLDPAEMLGAVQGWQVSGLGREAGQGLSLIREPFATLTAPVVAPIAPIAPFGRPAIPIPAVRAVEAPEPPTRIVMRVPAVNEERAATSIIGAVGSNIATLLATFIALGALGFGLVFFAPQQLEVVADTVRQSFWRSFFAGLFAQPLILPAYGLLLLGLVLTIVGILLVPFAAIALALITVLALVSGYLAVARSMGEVYLRRKMAQGQPVGGWLSYRYVLYGLAMVLALWVPAALLSWVPIAGTITVVSAATLTWMILTAGLGATILSRAGIRGTFTRRFDHALTDELFYQTPQATPVVRSRDRLPKSRQ